MVVQIHVVPTTCMTMHERFTLMNALGPRRGTAPRRGRRRSTSGPLNQNHSNKLNQNHNLVQEVVRELELQWKKQELQQRLGRSRSQGNSRAGSRAGSVDRFGSECSLPGLRRSNSWGNLSQRSAPWRQSHGNLYGGRSRTVSFSSEPGFNLNLRSGWQRGGRQGRGRRGGHVQRGRVIRPNQQYQYPQYQRRGRGQGRGQNRQGQNQWRLNPWRQHGQSNYGNDSSSDNNKGAVTRSMARNANNAWNVTGSANGSANESANGSTNGSTNGSVRGQRNGRGRGRGRGQARGGVTKGVPQNSMPGLVSLEQLDQELDEYMAGTKKALDKELEEYMAQHAMEMEAI